MKSTSGEHYIALDHVRALAALMVVTWHFIHSGWGYPIPMEGAPAVFPLALLDEGHTGVALFMALSGYLFAKLLDGKSIDYREFLRNRALRLLPLFLLVLVIGAVAATQKGELDSYARGLVRAIVLPEKLVNGTWSVVIEFQFYLLLPALLWLVRRSPALLLAILFAAVTTRWAIWRETGSVQELAYWSLLGRIDQFVLGMLGYHFRFMFARRHVVSITILLAFCLVYWLFDWMGGYAKGSELVFDASRGIFHSGPDYPSPRSIWIWLPTLEGFAYAVAIAWYDGSFRPKSTGISWAIGKAGEYSYSIYLLHFYVVFQVVEAVDLFVMPLSNFYVATAWALVFFVAMIPVGHLSYKYIESPFLRFRRRYSYPRAAAQDYVRDGARQSLPAATTW